MKATIQNAGRVGLWWHFNMWGLWGAACSYLLSFYERFLVGSVRSDGYADGEWDRSKMCAVKGIWSEEFVLNEFDLLQLLRL